MRFKFPEGYLVATSPDRMTIVINGRDFSPDAFADLISPRPGEPIVDHARRVAAAIGVGIVITSQRS